MKKIIILLCILSALFARKVRISDNNGDVVSTTANSLDVMLSDATTPPVDTYFLKGLDRFCLLSNAEASTITNLNYTIFVSNNNGRVSVGDEIQLLDVVANWEFYAIAKITNGDGSVILDRPIDHTFTTNTCINQTVTSEMAVDGSLTNQIFTVRAGTNPIDITRILLVISDAGSMDDGKFGVLASLSNGVVVRTVDGFNKTIFNWKNNGEIGLFCYDTDYVAAAQGPAGSESFKARITFAGQSKHGVALRLSGDDVLQVVIQDNLSGLDSFKIVAQGHQTVGEN